MSPWAGRVSVFAGQQRAPLLIGLCVLLLALLPAAIASLWPPEHVAAVQRRDPRYVSQTGSLAGTRRQAIANANGEAVDHAVETCAAAGVVVLAAKYGIPADIPSVATRYARDFEVSARAARRTGCITGLREGG